ncbi:MAG: hypothetical protein WBG42_10690 [Cryomorphaceae bacterium]
MTENESLEIILKMIDRTKENLKQQSGFYLIWGWSIFAAASLEYVLLKFFEYPNHAIVWPIAILFGVAGSIYLGSKLNREKRVVSYADKALKYLWASWSAMLLIVIVFPAFGGYSWAESYLLIIALYGMGPLVSGGILSFKPLVIGGIFSFALAVIVMITGWYSDFSTMLLCLALSILGSYLIPGFLLRKS